MLLVAGYVPVSPLEFHFYAGEEVSCVVFDTTQVVTYVRIQGGLRGSQAIASSYEADGKIVRGMAQFDMTVRTEPSPSIVVHKHPSTTGIPQGRYA